MYIFKIQNASGEKLNLSYNNQFDVISVDGLYPPPVTINSSSYATINGSAVNGVKISSRPIIITLNIKSPVQKNRMLLYKYFAPGQSVRFYIKTDKADVYADGYVETMPVPMFNQTTVATITLVCPDPRLYDVEDKIYKFYSETKLFEFPFEFQGKKAISESQAVNKINVFAENQTGFVFSIKNTGTEAITNPGIQNETTGQRLQISGSLAVNDTVIINTCFGEKTAVNISHTTGAETNILRNLYASYRDLFELVQGENIISFVSRSSEMPSAELTLKFRDWRIGV